MEAGSTSFQFTNYLEESTIIMKFESDDVDSMYVQTNIRTTTEHVQTHFIFVGVSIEIIITTSGTFNFTLITEPFLCWFPHKYYYWFITALETKQKVTGSGGVAHLHGSGNIWFCVVMLFYSIYVFIAQVISSSVLSCYNNLFMSLNMFYSMYSSGNILFCIVMLF